MKPLDPEFIPFTVPEAVAELKRLLEPGDIEQINHILPHQVHMHMGMFLRNSWNMWDQESNLNKDFQQRYRLFGHGDDLSGLILEWLWNDVKGKPFDDKKYAERYRKHWKKYGIDPVTGKRTHNNPNVVEIEFTVEDED